MAAVYTATATSTGKGRSGHARSSDGLLDLDLAVPAAMGGPGGASNPEQLFAAGYPACFHSALQTAAEQRAIPVTGSAVTAHVHVLDNAAGGYQLAVELSVEIRGLDQLDADDLAAAAHEQCTFGNAARGNVDVSMEVAVS